MISRANMRRVLSATVMVAISLILVVGFVILPAEAGEPPKPGLQLAPLRPPQGEPPPVIDGHGTGFIPPQLDLSHLTGQQMPQGFGTAEPKVGGTLPDSFDWRATDKVTSVKDQGNCGSCYAFAAIGNVESKILIDGAATLPNPDYSENNVKECEWYDSSCAGGTYDIVASFLAQKGTVLESCDPYVDSDVACKPTCSYQKTLLDWRIISDDVVPDTNVLKAYIYNYGPVYTSMYSGIPGFGTYDGSYTIDYADCPAPDHAVLIVGWSNDLPAIAYPASPPGGGVGAVPAEGWIVKNSWGSTWGDEGYFYITYGSADIGMYSSYMYDWQDYDEAGGIMYYDEGGLSQAAGCGSTTCWGLCKFFPEGDTTVSRVEFWTTDVTTDVNVYLYDDFDGTNLSNPLWSSLGNSFNEAGYHGVAVDPPLPVTAGDDVIAVVQFTNAVYKFPVPLDANGPSEAGHSYASCDGSSWEDTVNAFGMDVGIRVRTHTALPPTIVTLEAYESQDEEASCPWVFTWNGSEYVRDNDVYSTARGAAKEYADYYTLNKPLLPKDGNYSLELRELTTETSYTDLMQLVTVDHPANVKVASDENGAVWTYSNPSQPVSATDNEGSDVLSQVATEDNSGFRGYNEDYVVLDFGDLAVGENAILVLRVNGFKDDGEVGDFLGVRPFVFIQTQNGDGEWVTRHSFYPRDDWAISAYNLAEYLTGNTMVRLLVASCHTGKYQIIDYVGLDTSAQSPVTISNLSPTSAIHSINGGVLDKIINSDDNYANMSPSEKMTLIFPVPEMAGEARDFVLVSEGYYIPGGTYYIYTWDGSDWVERGSWEVGADGDQVHDFDLSPFLPDADGKYRVRIFQSYSWDEAGIDYVGLTLNGVPGVMTRAWDLQKDESVLTELQASDDVRDDFWEEEDEWNRWVEVEWGLPPVGGELYPVNKLSILAPWLGLALLLALGGGFVVVRRRFAR